MYLTTKEWKEEWGGFKGAGGRSAPFRQLPFHCCAITFTRFEEPVCTDDGVVYDITNAVPYVMKFKRHPVSGEPLQLKARRGGAGGPRGRGRGRAPLAGWGWG